MNHLDSALNDGELVALRAIHLGLLEYYDGEGKAAEWNQLIKEHINQHGQAGILGLVAGMARHASLYVARHIEKIADEHGDPAFTNPDEWLHHWQMHKLAQHQAETDDPDDDLFLVEDEMLLCTHCYRVFTEGNIRWIEGDPGRYVCAECEAKR